MTRGMLPEPLIGDCSVGRIELGMAMDSIYKFFARNRIYSKVYTYDGTGRRESTQVVDMDGKTPYMVFEKKCYGKDEPCTIWRITVRTPKYYTKKDLRVGNTFKELRAMYVINSVGWEDGNLVAYAEQSNIAFFLDTRKIPESWYFTMSPALMPHDVKILGIRITEDLESNDGPKKRRRL